MFDQKRLIQKMNTLSTTKWKKLERYGAKLTLNSIKIYFKIAYLLNRGWPETIQSIRLKNGNTFDFSTFYYKEDWLDQIEIVNDVLNQLSIRMTEGQLIDTVDHLRFEMSLLTLLTALEKEFKCILALKPNPNGKISYKHLKRHEHLFDAFKKTKFSDEIMAIETDVLAQSPLTINPVVSDITQLRDKKDTLKTTREDDQAA